MILFTLLSLIKATIVEDLTLTLGMDVLGNTQLTFLKDFEQYFPEFHEKGLQMQVIYRLFPCYTCESRHQYTQPEKNCYGGGRYCCQVLLQEILRQQCILEKKPDLYFNYTAYFAQECSSKPTFVQACSSKYFEKFNVSIKEIDQCIEESFVEEDNVYDKQLKKNRILEFHKEKEYNFTQFTLYVNEENKTAVHVKDLIPILCNSLQFNPPTFCSIDRKVDKIKEGNLLEKVFIIVLILLILIIVAQSGWKLLDKIQLSSLFVQKSKITIPKEKEHVILEDDL